jgi:adenosine deaminase
MVSAVSNRLIALPKAEVHIHLEGSIAGSTARRWASEAGVDLGPGNPFVVTGGLSEFLQLLDFICSLARQPEQLADLAYEFAQHVASSGAAYADVIVNPTHWGRWSSDVAGLVTALDAGFQRAEHDGLPSVGLCISLLRTQSAGEATALVDLLIDLASPRVVALSVDGNEAASGPTYQRFAEAFQRAGAHGLKRTVHAGESSGAQAVRDAIELLGADRIDHGVRAIEDDAVVALLIERQIPLGVCPSSNLTLGLYPHLREHPIEALRQRGVAVCVNTDDPALLGIDLTGEYQRCIDTFGWNDDVIRQVAATSIRSSFASESVKAQLASALEHW